MRLYSQHNTPRQNLDLLKSNPYPGRLLVMGYAGDVAVQAYAIGGRSDGSRNRVFVVEDNIVCTEVFDKTKGVGDPRLTIYDAMRRVHGTMNIVSNGDQTGTATQFERSGLSFVEAMRSREFEPDKPNYTSRISGLIDQSADPLQGGFMISVIRRSELSPYGPVHDFFGAELAPFESGVGYGVHTYRGEAGGRLLPLNEPPFRVPVTDDAQETAQLLWNHLDHGTTVAIVAKTIAASGEVDFGRINGHELAA